MQVLVTGAEGYIGTELVRVLAARGHQVTGLDAAFYSDRTLYAQSASCPRITKDIRDITPDDLIGFDAVVHLAELSNDPVGQFKPDVTYEINHAGTVSLVRACRTAGVSRFVYTSSCSVYGAGSNGFRTEDSPVDPQTAYARCKVLVERSVSAMADDTFTPTFLRNATAYGPSPSMRFDIVLNNLAGWAWTSRRIALNSDGTAWRPLVHVLDICEAIICCLEAPREIVHNQIFNVGRNDENFRVRQIGDIIAETFPGCELSFGASGPDSRSYRVSFDKIHERLPGFQCLRTAWEGARELQEVFTRIHLSADVFGAATFTRLKQLEALVAEGRLDNRFRWVVAPVPAAREASAAAEAHPRPAA